MKFLITLASTIIFLTACTSEEPVSTLTQKDCLEQGQFKYGNMCVNWRDLPDEETQADVINEIAEEIAQERGISKEQAIKEVMAIVGE